MKKQIAILIFGFFINSIGPIPSASSREIFLPPTSTQFILHSKSNPPVLKGLKVNPNNPFRFDFVLDLGNETSAEAKSNLAKEDYLKNESKRLIKYFLASLTIPEEDLWVNLSPYEKDRIVPDGFGRTEMGRDLLAEDYVLKQLTASLLYPEDELGRRFWNKVYAEAAKQFGTTNIPVNTFNKVWIVPNKAVIYENPKESVAYVTESSLKVMLEEDYLSKQKNLRQSGDLKSKAGGSEVFALPVAPGEDADRKAPPRGDGWGEDKVNSSLTGPASSSMLASNIIREIIIPELTREINEGQNFAKLRQVYQSLILAAWYKKKIKASILAKAYVDQKKIRGLESVGPVSGSTVSSSRHPSPRGGDGQSASSPDAAVKTVDPLPPTELSDVELIYQRYLEAFKKGAYNFIKEEIDPITKQSIPRKYFSGGADMAMTVGRSLLINDVNDLLKDSAVLSKVGLTDNVIVTIDLIPDLKNRSDLAMIANYIKVAELLAQLSQKGLEIQTTQGLLSQWAKDPQKLADYLQKYSVIKDPSWIEKILQAKLDAINSPATINDPNMLVLFDALFDQNAFLQKFGKKPLNILIYRGGRGASQYTEVLKALPNVRVQIMLGAVDDGRSWYVAARDFNATGIPDAGKSLLDLAEDTAVKDFLSVRLDHPDNEALNKDLETLAQALVIGQEPKFLNPKLMKAIYEKVGGIDLEKRKIIGGYLKSFLVTLKGRYATSTFSLNQTPLRSVVLLGAAWKLEKNHQQDYWQQAIDDVGQLLGLKEGNRVILPTNKRQFLVAMTADGTIYGAETGVNELLEKPAGYVGLWLFDKPLDLEQLKKTLEGKGFGSRLLEVYDPQNKYDKDLKNEIESTTLRLDPDTDVNRVASIISRLSSSKDPNLKDPQVELSVAAKKVISKADAIIYAMTTFESNIGSSLIVPGMGEAIAANAHAVKIHLVNPTTEAEPYGTTAVGLLERLYRYATRRFTFRNPFLPNLKLANQYVQYMVGVPAAIPGLDRNKTYLPFVPAEISRLSAGHVLPVSLDLEQKNALERKSKNYKDVNKEWGFYDASLLYQCTIALLGLHRAGFKLTPSGGFIKKPDNAMASESVSKITKSIIEPLGDFREPYKPANTAFPIKPKFEIQSGGFYENKNNSKDIVFVREIVGEDQVGYVDNKGNFAVLSKADFIDKFKLIDKKYSGEYARANRKYAKFRSELVAELKNTLNQDPKRAEDIRDKMAKFLLLNKFADDSLHARREFNSYINQERVFKEIVLLEFIKLLYPESQTKQAELFARWKAERNLLLTRNVDFFPAHQTIGDMIRIRRVLRGWTIDHFRMIVAQKKPSLSYLDWHKIEKNKYIPTREALKVVQEILGFENDELLKLSQKEKIRGNPELLKYIAKILKANEFPTMKEKIDPKSFGQLMDEQLKAQKVNGATLAYRLGLGVNNIESYLKGRNLPQDLETVAWIEMGLGFNPGDLMQIYIQIMLQRDEKKFREVMGRYRDQAMEAQSGQTKQFQNAIILDRKYVLSASSNKLPNIVIPKKFGKKKRKMAEKEGVYFLVIGGSYEWLPIDLFERNYKPALDQYEGTDFKSTMRKLYEKLLVNNPTHAYGVRSEMMQNLIEIGENSLADFFKSNKLFSKRLAYKFLELMYPKELEVRERFIERWRQERMRRLTRGVDLFPDPSEMTLGKMIQIRRVLKNIDRVDFARTLGISLEHMRNIELHGYIPSDVLLKRIHGALNLGEENDELFRKKKEILKQNKERIPKYILGFLGNYQLIEFNSVADEDGFLNLLAEVMKRAGNTTESLSHKLGYRKKDYVKGLFDVKVMPEKISTVARMELALGLDVGTLMGPYIAIKRLENENYIEEQKLEYKADAAMRGFQEDNGLRKPRRFWENVKEGAYLFKANHSGEDSSASYERRGNAIHIKEGDVGLFDDRLFGKSNNSLRITTDGLVTCTGIGIRAQVGSETFYGLAHIKLLHPTSMSLIEQINRLLYKLEHDYGIDHKKVSLIISFDPKMYRRVISKALISQVLRNVAISFSERGLFSGHWNAEELLEVSSRGVKIIHQDPGVLGPSRIREIQWPSLRADVAMTSKPSAAYSIADWQQRLHRFLSKAHNYLFIPKSTLSTNIEGVENLTASELKYEEVAALVEDWKFMQDASSVDAQSSRRQPQHLYVDQIRKNSNAFGGFFVSYHSDHPLSKLKMGTDIDWGLESGELDNDYTLIKMTNYYSKQIEPALANKLRKLAGSMLVDRKYSDDLNAFTRGAILALKRANPRNKVVYVGGVGDGVLAIVSAKLGARKVIVTDRDHKALKLTAHNARENNIPEGQIVYKQAGDYRDVVFQEHEDIPDIVIANLPFSNSNDSYSYYPMSPLFKETMILAGFSEASLNLSDELHEMMHEGNSIAYQEIILTLVRNGYYQGRVATAKVFKRTGDVDQLRKYPGGRIFKSNPSDDKSKSKVVKRHGGIDFNPDQIDLTTRVQADQRALGASRGIDVAMSNEMLEDLRNSDGFEPVIISITPLKDIRTFMGIS